jgi:hypothetical protein
MWGIFKIGRASETGKIYLADGFSFYWLFNNPSIVEISQGVDRLVVKFLLNNASVICQIGDKYTADILSKLLDIEVPVGRPGIFLKPGDYLYIFRISSIVEKGQVLSKEEVLDLYDRGKIWFDLVKVLK